jgi:hypothetical protein
MSALETRFTSINTKIDEANKQIDSVIGMLRDTREEQLKYQSEQKTYALRYVATTAISFVITIATIVATRFIH